MFCAAKAIEVVVVELHRRSFVIVENAGGHSVTHLYAVILGGRGNADGCLNLPEDVQVEFLIEIPPLKRNTA